MALSSLERLFMPKRHELRMRIAQLIDVAEAVGLPAVDINNATEALDSNEFGDALDTILVQLYEYDVPLDSSFIVKAREACHSMQIDWDRYSFVESLAISRGEFFD